MLERTARLCLMPARLPNLELTTSEKEVLRVYRELLEQHRKPPTFRAMADVLGISPGAVHYCTRRLAEKGYMKETPVTSVRLTLSAKGKKAAL